MNGPETRPSLIGHLADPTCQQAWAEFVRLYQNVIYRVARARGLQDADAEDVTQEVLATVSRKVERFDCQAKGSFRGWLQKLTRDAAIDRLRQPKVNFASGDSEVRQRLQQFSQSDQTEQLWEIECKRERLLEACERIRDEFSKSVWLSFWYTAIKRQSIVSTSQQLGKSEGSIRVARCRVMARLKKEVVNDDCSSSF